MDEDFTEGAKAQRQELPDGRSIKLPIGVEAGSREAAAYIEAYLAALRQHLIEQAPKDGMDHKTRALVLELRKQSGNAKRPEPGARR